MGDQAKNKNNHHFILPDRKFSVWAKPDNDCDDKFSFEAVTF